MLAFLVRVSLESANVTHQLQTCRLLTFPFAQIKDFREIIIIQEKEPIRKRKRERYKKENQSEHVF